MENKKLVILLIAGAAACMAYTAVNTAFGERERIEYVSRNPAGEAEKKVGLEAVIEGNDPVRTELTVPSVQFSEEEAKLYFDKAAAELEKAIPGEGNRSDRIVRDISLPGVLPDNPVSIEWSSSHPGILASSGQIVSPSADGDKVTLTALMTLDGYEEKYIAELVVFPKESDTAGLLKSEAEKINTSGESERYFLPSEVNGKEVIWYEMPESKVGTVAVILLLAALLLVVRDRKQKEAKTKARNDALKKAYPELISRILLLSYAGLGIRKIMYRIAAAEREASENGNALNNREAYEEIEKICTDMDNGIGETEAYERFGERCSEAGYRTLSVLLARSAKRGSSGMLTALDQEVTASFEERKRRAKAAGDLAAVKLLLPMALMLVVVMVVVLVPSFLSFLQ